MTSPQLNRDIKSLYNKINEVSERVASEGNSTVLYDYLSASAKPEFTRLFYADKEFKYMTKQSIRIMLRLNVRHRFIPLHLFGIHIDL